jgi:ABC-type branched-subunit amino acid transport system substrate-binding protein
LILNVRYGTLTAVSDKGWVGWATENRLLVGAIALVTAVSLTIVAVVASNSGGSSKKKVASNSKVAAGTGVEPGANTTESTLAGGAVVPGASGAGTTGSGGGGGGRTTGPSVTVPGVALPGGVSVPSCAPKAGFKATGLDDKSVSIGQIVTDNNALPAQLKPNKEGLEAYVNLVNAAGGVCGRKINIVYRNDNLNPATHDYQGLAKQVFAFVANSSLLDSNDYDNTPPFNPKYTDNGQFVPDVGGLAYAYSRSQSQWHAGTVGSISPTLVGGLGFKLYAERAKLDGGACKKGAIMYLTEPTGASKDSAIVGDVAVRGDWGANLGNGNTKFYVENLAQPELVYEQEAQKMITDGMNCVFTYMDLGSNVALVQALAAKGVWPPDKCKLGPKCFRMVGVPFSAYDPKFIHDGGEGARFATTFLPHVPLNETSSPAMQTYLNALKKIPGATPSTFSLIGWGAGQMFVEAMAACGAAPTRNCVMDHLRGLKGFTAGGLISGTTPFQTTKATCGDCGSSISWKGTFAWKWIFSCIVGMQVQDRGGVRDFYRTTPDKGFVCGPLRVARGTPA